MRFSTIIFRGLARRPARTILTCVAMTVGVAAFVALVGVSDQFEGAFLAAYKRVEADVIVVRAGGQERLSSALRVEIGDQLRKIPGVLEVAASLTDIISLEQHAAFFAVSVQGLEPNSLLIRPMDIIAGRTLKPGDGRVIILGKTLALNLDKKVGDDLELYEGEPFKIVGIYESYNVLFNSSMVMTLSELQRLMDRPGQATGFCLRVDKSGTPAEAAARIQRVAGDVEKLGLGLDAFSSEEHVESLAQLRIVRGMAWLTAAIALILGAIGVLNTMFTSVLDRTHEIGVLRAIGWRRRRVVSMILWESVVMSLIAAGLGIGSAMALIYGISKVPLASVVLDGHISWHVAAQGAVLAVAVGVLGAAYPAMLSARLRPTEALRHE